MRCYGLGWVVVDADASAGIRGGNWTGAHFDSGRLNGARIGVISAQHNEELLLIRRFSKLSGCPSHSFSSPGVALHFSFKPILNAGGNPVGAGRPERDPRRTDHQRGARGKSRRAVGHGSRRGATLRRRKGLQARSGREAFHLLRHESERDSSPGPLGSANRGLRRKKRDLRELPRPRPTLRCRVFPPLQDSREDLRVLSDLARILGLPVGQESPAAAAPGGSPP
jgi:hypothetical protein